jgi:hypothetical protein
MKVIPLFQKLADKQKALMDAKCDLQDHLEELSEVWNDDEQEWVLKFVLGLAHTAPEVDPLTGTINLHYLNEAAFLMDEFRRLSGWHVNLVSCGKEEDPESSFRLTMKKRRRWMLLDQNKQQQRRQEKVTYMDPTTLAELNETTPASEDPFAQVDTDGFPAMGQLWAEILAKQPDTTLPLASQPPETPPAHQDECTAVVKRLGRSSAAFWYEQHIWQGFGAGRHLKAEPTPMLDSKPLRLADCKEWDKRAWALWRHAEKNMPTQLVNGSELRKDGTQHRKGLIKLLKEFMAEQQLDYADLSVWLVWQQWSFFAWKPDFVDAAALYSFDAPPSRS